LHQVGKLIHNSKQAFMSSAEFEPAIPAIEWPHTYNLDSAVTGFNSTLFSYARYTFPYDVRD